ncbi:MAG: hypothetical protein ACRD1U_06015, partial [Vicinamibacterales bacterium]
LPAQFLPLAIAAAGKHAEARAVRRAHEALVDLLEAPRADRGVLEAPCADRAVTAAPAADPDLLEAQT